MVFRPQDVALLADAPIPNAGISGVISYREFLGASVRYGVRLGSAEILADMPFRAGDALYALGQPVTVSIATGSIRWLAA